MNRRQFFAAVLALAPWSAWAAGKKKAAKPKSGWEKLSPDEQSQAQERWQKFINLSPARQDEIRAAWARLKKMPPAKRKRLQKGLERWATLTDEQRTHLRAQYRHWKSQSAGERRREQNEIMRGRKDSQL